MRTFKLEKLVRDGIVEGHLQEGGSVDYSQLRGQRLLEAMIKKFDEELTELKQAKTPEEQRKELEDILDLAAAALKQLGMPTEAHEPRTYDEAAYIRTVTLPEDSKWTEYYANDPDTFPEEIADD